MIYTRFTATFLRAGIRGRGLNYKYKRKFIEFHEAKYIFWIQDTNPASKLFQCQQNII